VKIIGQSVDQAILIISLPCSLSGRRLLNHK
jgi:hypothetical protein